MLRFVPSRRERRLATPAFALALLSAGLGNGAFAQPAAIKSATLDPVVVTAARGPQPIADLVADVTVIGPEEIARSGADSLAALLARQPGIEIVQNGGPGATTGVFIRGANRGQTVVLLDGLRIGSSTVGAASFEAIPLDQIERIEILRGPASSLYGADAIGGVIQIFTRRGGSSLAANASVGYGTYATATGAAGVSGTSGPVRYSLQVGGRRSDGFNAIANPANFSWNPDRDGYETANVTASASYEWAKDQSLGATYFRNRLDNQFDASAGHDDRTITVLDAWQVESRNRITPAWRWSIVAGRTGDDSRSSTEYGEYDYRTRDTQYRWQHDIVLPAGDLSLAYERREERLTENAGFAVTSRDTDSAIAVYRLVSGPQALQVNVRHDDSSQFGARTTGTLAWGWRFAPGWRLTASGGTAYKAPTFNDLYYPGYSNPDLDEETSRSLEAGLAWSGEAGGARINARATGWHNRVRSLIVFMCDANYVCAPQNVDRATLEGVTLTADASWSATTLKASLNLQSPTDDATGNLLPRRARTYGSLSALHRIGQVLLSAELSASSKRYDDAANTRAMAGYAIVNLYAEWAAGRGVTLFVRGDNVLDRDYELAADYSTGGAQVFAGLRWAM
ncbi:MAG: TonB-dependent receptor [Betaproteobacteria bacterium]|nr:TonB-dependent receptor [Betaproteobacteria bacterium]